MNVALITGINGFVGKHLGRLLKQSGFIVYGTSRTILNYEDDYFHKQFSLTLDDKNEIKRIIELTNPRYIFHLLAQSNVPYSWNNTLETMETNVNKTINLLESMIELKSTSRLINIGSSEEYGYDQGWEMPITETYPLKPLNPYGVSKAACSMLLSQYSKKFNLDIIHMRPFNHIGPGQKQGFVVPDFTNQIVRIEKGLIEPVLRVGNLASKRDFTDVRDIVQAYLSVAIDGKSGEVYNVCSGQAVSISEILNKLIEISGINVNIEIEQQLLRPIDIPIYIGSNHKLNLATKWKRQINLTKTLSDILEHCRNNL